MKKITPFVFILIGFIFIFIIGKTYSYYVDIDNANVNYKVASWVIVVNDEDITLESANNFEIKNFRYIKNKDTELSESNNKFAPGMTVEFDIEIDSKEVDVAFAYYLDVNLTSFDNENIKIAYVKNKLNNIELEDNLYHGYFTLDKVENNEKDLITVGITWEDNDLVDDYEFAKQYEDVLSVPVSITIKQKIN